MSILLASVSELLPVASAISGAFSVVESDSKLSQQAIGYQKEIKKTLGKTSETDAYLKFEMTSYVKCQTDL